MDQQRDMTHNASPIPPLVWFLTIGVLLGLTAIVVFKVPVATVANYGLLAFFIGAHFFMHGSHGGHGESADRDHNGAATNAAESDKPDSNKHSNHTGGCH